MSASTDPSESSSARPCRVSWTACSADSSRSSMISSAGRNRCSWRQSSDPMEPPAPVTRIRLPAKCPATEATSVCTGLRPSRSLIRGSRTPSIRSTPLSSSVIDGTTLGTRPHCSAWAVRSRIAVPLARAIAITSTVAPVAAAACGHRVAVAEHRHAEDAEPALVGSSSSMATGRYSCRRVGQQAVHQLVPASPAPNTITFTPPARPAGVRTAAGPRTERNGRRAWRAPRTRPRRRHGRQRRVLAGNQEVVSSGERNACPTAAVPTPTTSARLPRWYRRRYSPAIRPEAADSRLTASAARTAT